MASVTDVQIEIDAALAEENNQLRCTVAELLEILRQWEPDHASGEDRQKIVRAMYQIGVLHDPAKTVAAMKVGAGDTPMSRLFGCCADDEDKTANSNSPTPTVG
jgi:hypothetical protein